VEALGHETLATVALGPHSFCLRLPPGAALAVGARVAVGIDPTRAVWFDAETGAALSGDARRREGIAAP